MLQIRIFHPTDSDAVRRLFAGGQMDFAKGTELEEEIRSYIRRSLSGDLSDIPGHYQNAPGNNFWVAEADGEIKGTITIVFGRHLERWLGDAMDFRKSLTAARQAFFIFWGRNAPKDISRASWAYLGATSGVFVG